MTRAGGQGAAHGRNPGAVDLFLVAVVVIPFFLTACGNAPEYGSPPPEPVVGQAAVPTAGSPPRGLPPSPTLRRSTIYAPEESAQPPTDVPPDPSPSLTRVSIPSPTGLAPTPTFDLGLQIARGKRLVERNSCLECHTIDGQANFAPTLAGLFGTVRELEGGTTTIADEDYLGESIQNPDEKIVAGFATGAMPKVFFSDAELSALVEYIKSLQ